MISTVLLPIRGFSIPSESTSKTEELKKKKKKKKRKENFFEWPHIIRIRQFILLPFSSFFRTRLISLFFSSLSRFFFSPLWTPPLAQILSASCSFLPSPPPPFSFSSSSRWSIGSSPSLPSPSSPSLPFRSFLSALPLSFSSSSSFSFLFHIITQPWEILLRLSLLPGNYLDSVSSLSRFPILMSQAWRSSRCRG